MKRVVPAIVFALATAVAAELALIQPKEFASQLAAKSARPAIFHVGPNFLYRGKHIPGSIYAGPAAKPEGLELLRQAVAKLPRDRQIIVYCGCCPWDHCPNIKPAMEMLRQMGFTHVKALFLATNFARDWIDQGYPVEEGTPR
jgi:rhodanese-related sulfurtransferase